MFAYYAVKNDLILPFLSLYRGYIVQLSVFNFFVCNYFLFMHLFYAFVETGGYKPMNEYFSKSYIKLETFFIYHKKSLLDPLVIMSLTPRKRFLKILLCIITTFSVLGNTLFSFFISTYAYSMTATK